MSEDPVEMISTASLTHDTTTISSRSVRVTHTGFGLWQSSTPSGAALYVHNDGNGYKKQCTLKSWEMDKTMVKKSGGWALVQRGETNNSGCYLGCWLAISGLSLVIQSFGEHIVSLDPPYA